MTDPRSDLKQDTDLWQLVLACATCYQDYFIFGNLHGLRCAGALLQLNGKDLAFKLPSEWDEPTKTEMKQKYAVPYIKQYKQIFRFVAEMYPQYIEAKNTPKQTDYWNKDLFTERTQKEAIKK